MSDLLGGAVCLWLPSLWAEPFGIAAIEAMAAGAPVVASDAGGVRDHVVEGETGLLLPRGDPAALARAADLLASAPELARRMGDESRRRVTTAFDPGRIVADLLSLYREVAAEPAANSVAIHRLVS
jgi:glycosyltransferase involved in cell wall biosynthesis